MRTVIFRRMSEISEDQLNSDDDDGLSTPHFTDDLMAEVRNDA